ncbi:MAG: MoaD/ThiS family protein [Anaerolineae bacterium]
MTITVKLFAMLKRYAPEGYKSGQPFEVTLSEGSTIADLIAHLGIPERETKVAYVDGRARALQFELEPGAEVGLFPPVGGG